MNRARTWRSRQTAARLPIATPGLATTGVAVVGVGALAEVLARNIGADVTVRYTVLVCLLALMTTLPLALLRPAAAAVTVTGASVLSLAPFHCLTSRARSPS